MGMSMPFMGNSVKRRGSSLVSSGNLIRRRYPGYGLCFPPFCFPLFLLFSALLTFIPLLKPYRGSSGQRKQSKTGKRGVTLRMSRVLVVRNHATIIKDTLSTGETPKVRFYLHAFPFEEKFDRILVRPPRHHYQIIQKPSLSTGSISIMTYHSLSAVFVSMLTRQGIEAEERSHQ